MVNNFVYTLFNTFSVEMFVKLKRSRNSGRSNFQQTTVLITNTENYKTQYLWYDFFSKEVTFSTMFVVFVV